MWTKTGKNKDAEVKIEPPVTEPEKEMQVWMQKISNYTEFICYNPSFLSQTAF